MLYRDIRKSLDINACLAKIENDNVPSFLQLRIIFFKSLIS